jgi:Small-conductance mechanosensitive channel
MENISQWIEQVDTELLIAYGIEYGTAIVGAILIFVLGRWVAKGLTRFARKAMQKSSADPTIISFLSNVIYGLAMAMVVIAAISSLGVETTSLAAVIAAAGLAIGLALQGSLSNLASGVMIIMFRPFKNGDYIEAAGEAGTVEQVNIFTTHLKTPDNREIIVPNGSILGGSITNYSAKPTRRVDLLVGVSYGDDLAKVKKVLEDIISSDDRIWPSLSQ